MGWRTTAVEPDRDQQISGHDDGKRYRRPAEAVVEPRHDEQRDEADRRPQHDELLRRIRSSVTRSEVPVKTAR